MHHGVQQHLENIGRVRTFWIMRIAGPMPHVFLAAGLLLWMEAASQPEFVDGSGWLIEPFAYHVGGAGLTALGILLLIVRHLARKRP